MADRVLFLCLSSGSDSNCFYLGFNGYGILIDAGLGVRSIVRRLADNGISIDSIKAIFLTHDHIDHTRAVSSLGIRRRIPVYATEGTINGINCRECINIQSEAAVHYITKEQPIKLADFEVTAFDLPHDAWDCVGYNIRVDERIFTFLTDLGHITPSAASYISDANYLIIEANHDVRLLCNNSNYPERLKNRIRGDYGHLSNQQTADCLVENLTDKTRHIWACHLSLENNTPYLAYNTIFRAIQQRGFNTSLDILIHGEVSPLYEL